MPDNNIDDLLKDIFKKEIDGQNIPSGVKERMRGNLGLYQVEKQPSSFQTVSLVASVLLAFILSGSMLFPKHVTAFSVKLYNRLNFLVYDKTYNILEGYGEQDLNLPPTQAPEIRQEDTIIINEAKARVPFVLQTPRYLPEDIKLQDIKVSGEVPVAQVTLKYQGENKSLLIRIKGIVEESGSSLGYDIEDTGVERVEIRGTLGNLLDNKSGKTRLEWQEQGIVYRVEGTYTTEEIIKISKSFSP